MHKETYSLVLNSQTSTNITNNTNLASIQYNINWLGILPQKHRRYLVSFQCKTANLTNVGMVGPINAGVLSANGVYFGQIYVGMKFWAPNSIPTITSFGTGTGGAGTYNLDNAGLTLGNQLMYSTNSTFTSDVICSINFGSNNTIQNNSGSDIIGTLSPSVYPVQGNNLFTSRLSCTVPDNGPIEIFYPSNNNITVRFTNIDGTPVTRMTNYNLQLYFEPIIEDIKDINGNIQNNLLSGSY
jgi:hypothetical protein